MDGYDEHFNPYDGICPKHGHWKGPIDECPRCMEESGERDEDDAQARFRANWGICLGCDHFDGEGQCMI
jgi:hypothetical protein